MPKNPELARLTTLGQRIKHWRLQRGLTQAGLAKLAGVGASTISGLELNEQKKSGDLVKIAGALKINATYLATNQGDPEDLSAQPAAAPVVPNGGKYDYVGATSDLDDNEQELAWLKFLKDVAEIRERRPRPVRRKKAS
jgi:transcriptional regulator with XRE-family HTH domain